MSKTFSAAPDVTDVIEAVREDYHDDLADVTIAGLFAFDSESSLPVLNHHGYPAGAIVRITPLKDRALGMADATIVVDRAGWLALSPRQRNALIDHELTHLEVKTEEEEGAKDPVPVYDSLGRPKLAMRKHDHQFGWFDEVAKRHGEASPEVRQARVLMESSGQLYFDFEPRAQAA
jgi:Putative phage metallopeptidase